MTLRIAPTGELSAAELAALKRLSESAFGHPFNEDWDHALGGVHFFVEDDDGPVSHASVVERQIEIAGRRLRTGYVEAVGTRPDRRRRGLAGRVMRAASEYIIGGFELGALSTGENGFYEQLGWETWRGPTYVRTDEGVERTDEEDGTIMILRAASTPTIDLAGPISCEWRPGDVW